MCRSELTLFYIIRINPVDIDIKLYIYMSLKLRSITLLQNAYLVNVWLLTWYTYSVKKLQLINFGYRMLETYNICK